MDKTELRHQLKSNLLAIEPEQRIEKSRKACQNLISTSQFENSSTIMMFLSLPEEVDTSEAILHAWQLGKIVAVPKISWEQRHMIPVQINSLETGFATGKAGLKNPTLGVPVPFEEIDLVVTPALGFDRKGNRIGRGGSYYDRFFAHEDMNAYRCGFAYSEQIIDQVPAKDHDEPIDCLVTDEEIIYFNSRKGV